MSWGSRARRLLGLGWLGLLLAAGVAQAELKPGRPVPAFDTVLLDGKQLPAAELKGKAVLVVFWATWCPVCVRELPELQQLQDKYRSRGFEVLALSLDADQFVVEEFWKDYDYRMKVAMRAPRHVTVFGPIKGTPTLFLMGPDGVLRFAHIGALSAEKLEAQLVPLLAK